MTGHESSIADHIPITAYPKKVSYLYFEAMDSYDVITGSTVTISGYLVERFGCSPICNATVAIYINTVFHANVTTGASTGKFSINIVFPSDGSYAIAARFAGD